MRRPFWSAESKPSSMLWLTLADPDEEASEAERRARIAAAADYQKRVAAAYARGYRGANGTAPSSASGGRQSREARMHRSSDTSRRHPPHRSSGTRTRCNNAGESRIKAWRKRMETEESKYAYRSRPGLCELPNTHFKSHHGIAAVRIRGLAKVRSVALLGAITANILANAALLLA